MIKYYMKRGGGEGLSLAGEAPNRPATSGRVRRRGLRQSLVEWQHLKRLKVSAQTQSGLSICGGGAALAIYNPR